MHRTGTGRDGTGLHEARKQMGILWVRGNFDEERQRHEEQRGLVLKEVQRRRGGERARQAGRWIYKTKELGEVGRA